MFELDSFDRELGGVMCFRCRHLDETFPLRCSAFQQEIPDEVWRLGHNTPYPGDNGVVFDELSEDEVEARKHRMERKEELALAK